MKKKNRLRKFFNDVHLWLGIASGLILFIVCLTGTIYTFRTEIEHLANQSQFYVKTDSRSVILPVDTIITRLEKQLTGKVTSMQIPADSMMTYQLSVRPGLGQTDHDSAKATESRPKNYFVNPYTGNLVPQESGLSDFFANVMKMHRWLLLDNATGRLIVGSATIIFVFLILSGLIIWLPARLKNWKKGLAIKFSSNWKRINHDLHNAFGFYACVLLLVMALTGLCWSFEWYRDGLGKLLGAKVFRGRGEKPMQSMLPADTTAIIPLSNHIVKANILFPYRGDLRVNLPAETRSSVSITKNKTGFFAFAGPDKVQFDQFTGKMLKRERFADKRFNEKIADLIKPLHTGEIYGAFSKIIYFLVSLMATTLPVTGTLIWINKLKKKRKRKTITGLRTISVSDKKPSEAEIA